MIDPGTAMAVGSGAGGVVGLIIRFFMQSGENKLEALKEQNRHAEASNREAQEYRKSLQEGAQLDKGEPFKRRWLWGLFQSEGTMPDRIVPPPYNGHLWLFATAYCWAIFVCFLCPDVVIFSRAIDGDPTRFGLLFGIVEYKTPDRAIYLQTLAGVGSALLATANFILTTSIVGFSRGKR